MNRKLLLALVAGIMVLNHGHVFSQSSVSFGGDFMSRYIWRGLDLGGPAPCIQPVLKYSYTTKNEKHNITAGAWGSYTFSGSANEEIDLFATYTLFNIASVTVTDYFFPGLNTGEKNDYFVYSPDSTGHVFEGMVCFLGSQKIPVTFMFSMNLYGNDARNMVNDSTEGNIVMSKYIEIGYRHSFKQFDFNGWIGAALDKPDKEYAPTGYYLNKKAGIINIGIKAARSIRITDSFSIPVQCQLITNPMQQKIWLVLGITI